MCLVRGASPYADVNNHCSVKPLVLKAETTASDLTLHALANRGCAT